jgi:hypothetical protein
MNERIQQLAVQAGAGEWGDSVVPAMMDIEKFAELIIRECISTIENAENGYQDYRNQIEDGMRNHCISLIKNKLGVER